MGCSKLLNIWIEANATESFNFELSLVSIFQSVHESTYQSNIANVDNTRSGAIIIQLISSIDPERYFSFVCWTSSLLVLLIFERK